jgi:hypothetical protein
MRLAQLNLFAAWVGILLGFLSGLVLGLFFRREDWLGGYASLQRRLYRLAHISLFGLGAVNLLFYFTAQEFPAGMAGGSISSWSFIVGAATMPVCCLLMAQFPRTHLLFGIPVVSLLLGALLTLATFVRPTDKNTAKPPVTPHTLLVPADAPSVYSSAPQFKHL